MPATTRETPAGAPSTVPTPPPAGPALQIALLGPPGITRADRPVALPRRQSRALLYRLAAATRPVPRDELCFLFWPDTPDATARRNLVVLLNHLRRALPAPEALVTADGAVSLDPALAQPDTAIAAAATAAGLRERRLDHLTAAVALYRGPFLDGFALPAGDEFEGWAAREREWWERRHLEALEALIEGRAARGEWAAAIAAARQYLAVDELAETVQRRLIAFHAAAGDRAAALRQFAACAAALERELGVRPRPETRAAYEAARDGRTPSPEHLLADPAAAPAWRAAPAPRDAPTPAPPLPVAPDPLIGRAAEVAAARAFFTGPPHVRRLTLCGPGGAGKTRLALETARALRGSFADGVVFVALAPLRDPAQVVGAIARACGLREAGAATPEDALRDHLRDQDLLLVLDNCEHLLAAAPAIAALLAAAPRLRVLATSRVVLNLAGEQTLPVPPLPLPDLARLPPVAELAREPAVALLVARARAHDPAFRLTAANAADLAAICARLDGLPLAIELAAARLKTLAPRALLDRLDRRLALLGGGARDLPARHQGLRATIDWSYQLLGAGERALLAHLAPFAGGWTLAAAEAVCGATSDERQLALSGAKGATNWDGGVDGVPATSASLVVLDGLQALLDAHLLVRLPDTGDAAGEEEPRFGMLETIREYALERLAERPHDEARAVGRRHAAYYAELAEALRPRLGGPEGEAALRRLDAEGGNLRVALAWARDHDAGALGLRLAGALARYWDARGEYTEGRAWLAAFLADATGDDSGARAGALNGAAALARKQGDYGDALRLAAESLALYRARGDDAGQAAALASLGLTRYRRGDFPRAIAALEEATARRRALGDPLGLSGALNNLAQAVEERGDLGRAATLYGESLALKREVGDARGLCLVLNNLGDLARDLGDEERAVALSEEGLARARALGDRRLVANALRNLGLIARDRGDYDRAVALFEESLTLRRGLGDRRGAASRLLLLADAHRFRGDYARAAARYAESLALCRATGDALTLAGCLEGAAGLGAARGRPGPAARLLGAAAALRDATGAALPPPDRPAVAETAATARAALGAAAWSAAHAAGQALTPEAAGVEAAALAAELASARALAEAPSAGVAVEPALVAV